MKAVTQIIINEVLYLQANLFEKTGRPENCCGSKLWLTTYSELIYSVTFAAEESRREAGLSRYQIA